MNELQGLTVLPKGCFSSPSTYSCTAVEEKYSLTSFQAINRFWALKFDWVYLYIPCDTACSELNRKIQRCTNVQATPVLNIGNRFRNILEQSNWRHLSSLWQFSKMYSHIFGETLRHVYKHHHPEAERGYDFPMEVVLGFRLSWSNGNKFQWELLFKTS